jgi:hypothetical protein
MAHAQQSVPVDLSVAASIMLNRDHNGGCGIAKDTKFKAQLDFASAANVTAARPWEAIDFTTDPKAYMQSVLDAALGDNDAIDWDIGNNPNGWVHAPWMAQDREPYRGMTRERRSQPHELHPNQSRAFDNYAFGVYNSVAADAFRTLWADPANPETDGFAMQNGSVGVKLLFTTAPSSSVPYLENSKTVEFCLGNKTAIGNLAQLDIAVRDTRADAWTGWVFGTFIYWGEGSTVFTWNNVKPFTLQWGNDPNIWPEAQANITDLQLADVPELAESWFNQRLQAQIAKWRAAKDLRPWTGLFGRANGPIDNPRSSCLSCHNVAADFGRGSNQNPSMYPPTSWVNHALISGSPSQSLLDYFKNRQPDEPKLVDSLALDYSLQAMIGILNFRAWAECRGTPARHSGPVYLGTRPRFLNQEICKDVLAESGDITFTPTSAPAPVDAEAFSPNAFSQSRSNTLINTMKLEGGDSVSPGADRVFR